MTALLGHAPQPAHPAIVRRYSIQATVGNRYLIVGDDGRPVPTVARGAVPAAQPPAPRTTPPCGETTPRRRRVVPRALAELRRR
jgi:hypothetical protein